jgi:hypothetical protein
MIFLMLLASAALLAGAFFLIYHLVVNVFGALEDRPVGGDAAAVRGAGRGRPAVRPRPLLPTTRSGETR